MWMEIRRTVTIVAVLAPLGLAACSDDSVTGPQFGDLEFTPGFTDIELAREAGAVLSNEGAETLGPILIGAELGIGIGEISGQVCPDMETFVSPGALSSLAPGGSTQVDILVDMSAVDIATCPEGSYDIDVNASVGSLILAATTVRIDWAGGN
jgi:hypothetical protein